MPIAQLAVGNSSEENCRTFVFENEGHTLGNALSSIIQKLPDVEFCGYTVPHPMEAVMNLRIQMRKGRAVDALRKGLEELAAVSEHILQLFNQERREFESKTNM